MLGPQGKNADGVTFITVVNFCQCNDLFQFSLSMVMVSGRLSSLQFAAVATSGLITSSKACHPKLLVVGANN